MHPSAIIHDSAKIGENVSVGPFSIVEKNTVIEDGVEIRAHAMIGENTILRRNCKVFHGAVVGEIPQDLKFNGENTYVEVGESTVIREYVTIHRGTDDRHKTLLGRNCLIMAYAHVAHDCFLGDNVILANAVNLAGHVTLEDYVILGGLVPVHQFVRIGKHAYIGGGYRVSKDVPPFILASSEPLTYAGLNVVGLRRRGFTAENRSLIKKAYRLLFRSEYNTSQALEQIKTQLTQTEEVKYIIQFVEQSERGIIG
ncbi:MAG: acyl-ACP--UDP-N-acetylglucosamine O-acyltransferase [Candidatus Marinimicrobia bacterium]|nr:acyl-ACP--UDP-N-acetylglucosamine O-acyltransferase [Candidatus Neomarinimicrobiota bacterium]MCF7829230.1 acyl-ACP--UDP-N-acetylglucosamine O-acyltransferase [Candidatus Neomarinimicrobiota bacterium]MCF7881117.1 acyl-ACP--UDP-N-acetylglucosamine O-acyltransferase [Candidatus Neomarinimicrobiota bacterium]